MNVIAAVTEERSVSSAARESLASANGDIKAAVETMRKIVAKDRRLRDELTEPLIGEACYDAIRAILRGDRRTIWLAPRAEDGAKEAEARVVHLASGNLLMFPLPGGKRLAEAMREEISAAATFYSRQASDMKHKARWLELVAKAVPGKRKAGQVLTETRLRELQEEAGKDE